MKRFLLSCFVFLLFGSLAYGLFMLAWVNYTPKNFQPNVRYLLGAHGHAHTRYKEIKTVKDLDLLFLGSSHTYRGFDTRIFEAAGYKSFNLGSSSQSPIQTKLLLEQYLNQLNPKTIVYEVYPKTFTIDGVEPALDLISNRQNDWVSIRMAIKIHHNKLYQTLVYACMQDILGKSSAFQENKYKGSDTYISGGFVQRNPSYAKCKDYDHTNSRWRLRPEQLAAFDEVLALIKSKEIPIILVYAPIPSTLYNAYNHTPFDTIMANKEVPYYNLNPIVPLSDSLHFFDKHHLNQEGVAIFNRAVLELLEAQEIHP